MENVQLSVSDCLALINQTLEYAYPAVTVVGEVASFKVNQGKYVFFDLKDDQGSLPCFMTVWQLRQPLEDGMKVVLTGQPKLTPWGKFSITVRDVQPVGEGSLKRAFEMLVKKLQLEGLFDDARKRQLPVMPHHIGVITSTQAAGYGDFIKILDDRWGGLKIDVAHVQVQGMGAAAQVIRALEYFNEMAEPPEVVAIVRGGGSADDLATFNDEPLARAIAASRVTTLVGVGHEVDTSLADMVADVRAATPSNAAQLLVPDKQEVLRSQRRAMTRSAKVVVGLYDKLSTVSGDAVERMLQRLDSRVAVLVDHQKNLQRTLLQIDPKRVLNRGYSLVRDDNKRIIRGDAGDLSPGAAITIELEHAIIEAGVKNVSQK